MKIPEVLKGVCFREMTDGEICDNPLQHWIPYDWWWRRNPDLCGALISDDGEWLWLWIWRFNLVYKHKAGHLTEFLKRYHQRQS